MEMLHRLATEVERDGLLLVLADVDGAPGVDSVIEECEDRILADLRRRVGGGADGPRR